MKSLFAVLLVVTLTAGASALSCYTCTLGAPGVSTNTDACDDPFNSTAADGYVLKLNCSYVASLAPPSSGISNFDVCAKTTATINGVYTVARTCFDSTQCPSPNGCVSRDGATVCCCNTDFCNGAAVLGSTVIPNSAVSTFIAPWSTIAMIFAALFLTM